MKKMISIVLVTAFTLISIFSLASVSAAAEPGWIWYPAEDGYVTDAGLCTGENAADNSYATFTSNAGQQEGYFYPGAAAGNISGSLSPIPTVNTIALVKYRTSADNSKVDGQFVWHNGTAHGFKSFDYQNDGQWHFAVVNLENEDTGGKWTDIPVLGWFRFDFVNNTEGNAYSMDLAYIAMFETEEDANEYAAADGSETPVTPPTKNPEEAPPTQNPSTNPPKTGDANVVFAIAAAGIVLSVILKKKLYA